MSVVFTRAFGAHADLLRPGRALSEIGYCLSVMACVSTRVRQWRLGLIQVDIECAISTDANVLISGGDSAARTALARLIHERSRKREGLMLVVGSQASIQATPDSGVAPEAAGRTIFIEELAALDEPAQAELMRLIDGAEPFPHGARGTRVISGTAHNLTGRMASNLFSAQLFYRLNIIHIALDDERRLAKPSTVH